MQPNKISETVLKILLNILVIKYKNEKQVKLSVKCKGSKQHKKTAWNQV